MKLVFFGEVLPREVNAELHSRYLGRVHSRAINEPLLSYLEVFVQLGYEVHSLVPSFARSAIDAEFGINSSGAGFKPSVDPRTGIHYHYFNNDGPKFLRLFHKLWSSFRLLAKIRREVQSTQSSDSLLLVNFFGYLVYAWPCVHFRRSKFGRNSGVKYLDYGDLLPLNLISSPWLRWISKIQWRLRRSADGLLISTESYCREIAEPLTGVPAFRLPFLLSDRTIQQYNRIPTQPRSKGKFPFTIVYTGFFYSNYGSNYLIETVKLAEIKYPGKYRWRFAGSGPDYEDQLRQLSKRPGSSMEFLGYLDATELIKLQKSADLLIQLRARDQSPLGVYSFRYQPALKFIEYLLTGKPILTTDFPAIDTEMRPFLNFIDSNDPEDILAAIERICEHPPSQKLLKQGRDYVIEHHSASAVARELKTILEQIV